MTNILLTQKEAALLLKVQPDTLRKWGKLGIIKPHCRLNNRPRYLEENVNNLLNPKTPTTHAK